jgi:hypothetical protein
MASLPLSSVSNTVSGGGGNAVMVVWASMVQLLDLFFKNRLDAQCMETPPVVYGLVILMAGLGVPIIFEDALCVFCGLILPTLPGT